MEIGEAIKRAGAMRSRCITGAEFHAAQAERRAGDRIYPVDAAAAAAVVSASCALDALALDCLIAYGLALAEARNGFAGAGVPVDLLRLGRPARPAFLSGCDPGDETDPRPVALHG